MIDIISKYKDSFSVYTELRVHKNHNASIQMKDGMVLSNSSSVNGGISVRTYDNGAFAFASSPIITDENIKNLIKTSTEDVKFFRKKAQKNAGPLPQTIANGIYDFSKEGMGISSADIMNRIRELDDYIKNKYKDITSRTLYYAYLGMEKALVTAHGSEVYSYIPRTALYLMYSLEKNGEITDLYDIKVVFGGPNLVFNDMDNIKQMADNLYDNIRIKSEGIYAKSGEFDVVLGNRVTGILAHEAVGHTVEADFVMGGSIAKDYINEMVASPLITMVDFGKRGFDDKSAVGIYIDDEGTEAKDITLIDRGKLVSFMHNKESASIFGVKPTGNARAYSFSDEPLIRMRNTAIMSGESSLEEMIESIDDGYYLILSSNGQADSTSEFMFGITFGYEIKNGKLGKPIKDMTISGVAFNMLKTVDMVGNDFRWSAGTCGKKQPMPVGMGGPSLKCKVFVGGR